MKAILQEGKIVPLEPLPAEWKEGAPLEVVMGHADVMDVDAWAKHMNEICADSSEEDDEMMRQAIAEHRAEAKAQMRKEMGLGE